MGLNPAPALQSGPAVAPHLTAQPSTSTFHSPSTLTPTLPLLNPASPTGSADPHCGSNTNSAAPLHHHTSSLSSGPQQGQLPPDQPGQSHRHTGNSAGLEHQQSVEPGGLLDTSVLADRGKAFDLFRCAHGSASLAKWAAGLCHRLLCLFTGQLVTGFHVSCRAAACPLVQACLAYGHDCVDWYWCIWWLLEHMPTAVLAGLYCVASDHLQETGPMTFVGVLDSTQHTAYKYIQALLAMSTRAAVTRL